MKKQSGGRAFERTTCTNADFRGGPINLIAIRRTNGNGKTIQSNRVRSLGRLPCQLLSLTVVRTIDPEAD